MLQLIDVIYIVLFVCVVYLFCLFVCLFVCLFLFICFVCLFLFVCFCLLVGLCVLSTISNTFWFERSTTKFYLRCSNVLRSAYRYVRSKPNEPCTNIMARRSIMARFVDHGCGPCVVVG